MRWLPSLAIPSLVTARLRHRPGRWLLVALGVAAATALPVLAQGSAQLVASRAVGYGIGQLDPGDRSLTVSQPGVAVPPDKLAATDQAVRAQLARLSPTPAVRSSPWPAPTTSRPPYGSPPAGRRPSARRATARWW